jgi:hypothetical protein
VRSVATSQSQNRSSGPLLQRRGARIVADSRVDRRLTLYRDDSTVQVVYERVKTFFWTAGSSVLTIARYNAESGPEHYYVHWPRERFCWFKDEPGR